MLASVIEQCDAPQTVGVFGDWGSGKTSMMRQIEAELKDRGSCGLVWFESWRHQHDVNPMVALLQAGWVAQGRPN
jgi:Ni2+-binding GTPase involved in maturation of urease and hydrogenase